jgi:hypothetical protein
VIGQTLLGEGRAAKAKMLTSAGGLGAVPLAQECGWSGVGEVSESSPGWGLT